MRFAAVGTSVITSWFVAGVRQVPDAEVACVVSRNADKGRAFADANGVADVETSLDAALARDDVDAVYIASPNLIHVEQALASIAAGKHVLVEKSMAPSADQARQIFEAADAAGVVAMEAMRPIHTPAFVALREAMGTIGDIRSSTFRYCQRSGRLDKLRAGDVQPVFNPRLGGGSLSDIGIYVIEGMVALFGAPEDVIAMGVMEDVPLPEGPEPVDIAGQALCRYPGHVANLAWGKACSNYLATEIEGENASLSVDSISTPRSAAITRPAPSKDGYGTEEGVSEPLAFEDPGSNNMRFEIADFIAGVTGGPANLSVADAREVTLASLALIDKIRPQLGVRP